jgi:hypothetical protein
MDQAMQRFCLVAMALAACGNSVASLADSGSDASSPSNDASPLIDAGSDVDAGPPPSLMLMTPPQTGATVSGTIIVRVRTSGERDRRSGRMPIAGRLVSVPRRMGHDVRRCRRSQDDHRYGNDAHRRDDLDSHPDHDEERVRRVVRPSRSSTRATTTRTKTRGPSVPRAATCGAARRALDRLD